MSREGVIRRSAEAVGWGAVAGVGSVMITQAFGWDGTRLVSTLQALTPYGIPLIVLVAAIAVWRDSQALAGAAAAVGLGALLLSTPIAFPPGQPAADPTAIGLRAASVNLLYSNPRVDELAAALLAEDPDVIVFSEFTEEHEETLGAHPLSGRYPFQINWNGLFAGGMAVWSKYPLAENPRAATINRSIDTSLDGPDGTIRVLAVHPPTPIYDHDAWTRDLQRIRDAVDGIDEPTLVIGDFNASYWHPVFRDLLRGRLSDAHIAAGSGWSTSWPTDAVVPPFVRLDHALTGNGLVSTAVEDFRLPGSDHAAFVVTVRPTAR